MTTHPIRIALAALALAASASAETLQVPGDYATIQEAIEAAVDGDLIAVAPGTYPELIDLSGKAITLFSLSGDAVTTIDGMGMGSVVRCQSGEGPDTVIQGFTIRGGAGGHGGGLRCDPGSPTVLECAFESNTAGGFGGAIYVSANSAVTVLDTTFVSNSAAVNGGAIYVTGDGSGPISGCSFVDNSASGLGGAMVLITSAGVNVTDCEFRSNVSYGNGGAVSISGLGSPTFDHCLFTDNVSTTGAGGAVVSSAPLSTFNACTFEYNTASSVPSGSGGAIYADYADLTTCSFTGNRAHRAGAVRAPGFAAWDCRFVGNEADLEGGAVQAGSPTIAASVADCTFTANSTPLSVGGGLHLWGNGWTVEQCIFRDNVAANGGGMFSDGSGQIRSCQFRSNVATGSGGGSASIAGTPVFINSLYFANSATDGGAHYAYSSSRPEFRNCSLSGNEATNPSGNGSVFRLTAYGPSAYVYNTVIHGNLNDSPVMGFPATLEHCVLGVSHAGNNVVADPLFRDPANGDLRLRLGSPGINFGLDAYVPAGITTDLAGADRFSGARVDAGAYEAAWHDVPHVPR